MVNVTVFSPILVVKLKLGVLTGALSLVIKSLDIGTIPAKKCPQVTGTVPDFVYSGKSVAGNAIFPV